MKYVMFSKSWKFAYSLTVNQLVVGLIPTAGAIFQNIYSDMQCVLNVLFLYNKSYKEL